MSASQREKGKRGELELAAALTLLTGVAWRRTAQRCGTHTGDVEADRVPVHVECKRYRAGLSLIVARMHKAEAVLCYTPNAWVCRMEHMPLALAGPFRSQLCHATRTPALLHDALIQAEKDRDAPNVSLVCAREDQGPWLCAWSPRDTQMLRDRLLPLMASAGSAAP